jgi:peptidoglycan LD-endopeptidase CwlK
MSLNKIEQLHPSIKDEVKKAYLYINKYLLGKGVRFEITQGLRTIDAQNALYAQGRTTKGNKVTNAKGGQSLHNFGLAFDIAMVYDLNHDGNFEKLSWDTKKDGDADGDADWMEVVRHFKKIGYTWGGDFKSIVDAPHFEKTFGNTWQKLLEKHIKKDFIPGSNYVKI